MLEEFGAVRRSGGVFGHFFLVKIGIARIIKKYSSVLIQVELSGYKR